MDIGDIRPELTGEVILELYTEAHKTNPNLTPWQHAQLDLQIPYNVYAARVGIAKTKLSDVGKLLSSFDLGEPWKFDGDWMILGDVHIPFVRTDWATLVALIGYKHLAKPRHLLIAGDFFNMDSFSSWSQVVQVPTWAVERDAAKAILHTWMDVFEDIRLLVGNHERRLQRYTAGAFDTNDILSLVISNPQRVRMSGFGYCEIQSGEQKWRITHPGGYSINQLWIANDMANKYDCNMWTFHEHHLAIGWDRYKRYVLVNGGGLVDDTKLPYMTLEDNKKPRMARGFGMLKNGSPYLFGDPPFTDWKRWL